MSSHLFHKTSDIYASGIKVIEQDGDGIVPLIESGKLHSDEMKALLKTYLKPMIDENIDYLVLGCTHYPYLIPILKKLLPDKVTIIDSGLAVAKQTKNVLTTNNLLNQETKSPTINLYTNGNVEVLDSMIENKFETAYLDF